MKFNIVIWLLSILLPGAALALDPWSEPVDQDSLYPAFVAGKWGFIDRQGVLIISTQYKSVRYFSQGLAAVCDSDGKCGYLGINGSVIIPLQFDRANSFADGLASVEKGPDVFFIHRDGSRAALQPPKGVETAEDLIFSEQLAPFKLGGLVGYMQRSGEILIQPTFSMGDGFREGRAAVEIGQGATGLWGVIEQTGKLKVSPIYSYVGESREGKIRIMSRQQQWGFLGRSGDVSIAPVFYGALDFSEGLAPVAASYRNWGYINSAGEWVLSPRFRGATQFTEGLAAVSTSESTVMIIDHRGTEVFTVDGVRDAGPWRGGLAMFIGSNGMCYVDKEGTVVWPQQQSSQVCRVSRAVR